MSRKHQALLNIVVRDSVDEKTDRETMGESEGKREE